jgi:Fe-Mn family superoxide dismutase
VPKYELPELPYDYSALEPHYSAEVLELHHDKHHKAYVDGANTTFEKLGEARESGDFGTINQLEKNMAFHLSGHVLHSLFWTNMSPDGGGEPDGDLAAAVKEWFGSYDGFRAQLTEAAMNVQGSGWGALSWEPLAGRLIVEQVYDHQGNVGQGGPPLLVLDMWEHAYYL